MKSIKGSFSTIGCKHLCAGNAFKEHEHKIAEKLNTSMSFSLENKNSGPIEVHILAGNDVIAGWRTLLGPTRVYKAVYSHPNSIRGLFGLSDTRNVCHGSDSEESAKREIGIFFSDFNVDRWLEENRKS